MEAIDTMSEIGEIGEIDRIVLNLIGLNRMKSDSLIQQSIQQFIIISTLFLDY